MENYSFLKKMLFESKKSTSLVILNQKQFKGTLNYIVEYICKEVDTKVTLILTSITSKQLLEHKEITSIKKENLLIIDLASGKNGSENINGFETIFLENPSDLTQLEIALENLPQQNQENSILIFESLSALNNYISLEKLEKFSYIFVNRLGLQGKTGIILTVKNNTTQLELIEQFFDKVYDYSPLSITSIEKVQ